MTRLLIVDDSPLMRRLLGEIFAEAGDFTVDIARSGEEALAKLAPFAPDVVTLDIQMPGMDGLACLDRIMIEHPCPVVMVSALTEEGAEETLEALAIGAVDFIPKPGGALSIAIEDIAENLVERVRAAARARIPRSARLADRLRHGRTRTTRKVSLRNSDAPVLAERTEALPVVEREPGLPLAGIEAVLVGVSTGGPPALDALLQPLPADFPWPIVIAQHMPGSFTGPLARRLDRLCAIDVVEASAPVPLRPGCAYIGRGDADLLLTRRGGVPHVLAAPEATDHPWHPSVDRLVASARRVFAAEQLVGVLMTGMGNDGAREMTAMRAAGGHVIAQDEHSAVVWGMPGALVAADGADLQLSPPQIAAQLIAWFRSDGATP